MPIFSVSTTNFRNLVPTSIDVLGKEIFLVGKNAQGKTNFLEALYITAYGASFRTRKDDEIYAKNTQEYSIRVSYKDSNEKTQIIKILSKDKKKTVSKNLKKIKDRKELVNTIPCVLFCHDDLDFVIGSPERKRFFIDQTISMYDNGYISLLRNFKKILKTRNLCLKEKKRDILDSVDIQFARLGQELVALRQETIITLSDMFSQRYELISGVPDVSIRYSSSWKHKSVDDIITLLKERREKDIALETSFIGAHRDKIHFVKDGKPFVPTASTGQRRLIAVILRCIQAELYRAKTSKKPILLLDDVLLELDTEKKRIFMDNLPEYDQIFCTFLPGEPYTMYKKDNTLIYYVEDGAFSE